MGMKEKVISALLKDKVGTASFCCCECRMVSGESHMGAVSDVSAGYAKFLRVVGSLVNEVCSLKNCKMTAGRDQSVVIGKQMGWLNRDVNFSRDAIFNEIWEVTERQNCNCSIILRGCDCNSVNDVCGKFKEACHVLNDSVEFSDVAKIGDRKLYRMKVLNNEKRSEFIMVTGKLKCMRG